MEKSVAELRAMIAQGKWRKPTSGLAPGFTQANVVILPRIHAFDFLLYCTRNDRPCPVIDVCEAGVVAPPIAGPAADIRTQVPRYRIYRHGELERECDDILSDFTDDMVTFLLGCSFTFEQDLLDNGVPVRHIELDRNVPMYVTNRDCRPAGIFSGPLVVSMRPIPEHLIAKASEVTGKYRKAHGAPIHAGDPAALGIRDITKPDFGDPPEIRPGEVPVFWACGVTPQMALQKARPELVITHAPGYMFITDIRNEDLARL
ncbi:putative hydro-lyase [Propionivibrio soli]|uniref:putative hydro-lyase n=1 Tax=Propionivibrio soli TaxID=2976531 RepID=UPI0021E896A8|nr:putative hydro-lyase [Propionivibrio soli]